MNDEIIEVSGTGGVGEESPVARTEVIVALPISDIRDEPTIPLEERAIADAASWVAVRERAATFETLEGRNKAAAKAVAGKKSLRNFRNETGEPQKAEDDSQMATAQRFLRGTFSEVRTFLQGKTPVPHIKISAEASETLPRSYVAARSYLTAVANRYGEASFLEYMSAVQREFYFENAELGALKPMMQLTLSETAAEIIEGRAVGTPVSEKEEIPALRVVVDSLRELADADLQDVLRELSRVEAILRQDPAAAYARMDAESADSYRGAAEELSRRSDASEIEVAQLAVDLAAEAQSQSHLSARTRERRSHVGFYLVGRGRRILQQRILYKRPLMRRVRESFEEAPALFYFLSVEVLIFVVIAFIVSGLHVGVPVVAATLLLLLPASETALEIINQMVTFLVPAKSLPKLDFSKGIPPEFATIVAIPTLLIAEQQIRDLVRTLEIRYVGNRDANLYFALLTDPPDSDEPFDDKDQHVLLCSTLIEQLNQRYGVDGTGPFFHFHRHRVFNEVEKTWMGWERKRGKLLDFNELLRGGVDNFPVKVGDLAILPRVQFVITLDSDTQLPRESAHRLVGALAHPLNRAEINPETNVVQEGYGVLQPRVGISVQSATRSRLAYIYSGQTGLDTYTRAVSDVYQDFFDEGIFTGKGIYEVDVFRTVLRGRFPSNAILSHDLIEGAYCRAGLLSDVEVIDDYPSHFSAYSRRKHRWVRGDWQIMSWLLPSVPVAGGGRAKNPLGFVSRWKILDNLRRSIIETAIFALLLASWFYLPGSPAYWTVSTIALLVIPRFFQVVLATSGILRSRHFFAQLKQILADFAGGLVHVAIFFAFLAHQTMVTLDAVFRTLVRLTVTRRNLLQWETAAQSELETKQKTPVDVYLKWTPAFALAIGIALAFLRPHSLPAAAPLLTMWMLTNPLARWLDRPPRTQTAVLSESEETLLRVVGLKTWRYFQDLCDEKDRWLIPDNVQAGEPPEIAHRLSPTNLGLLFNAQYAAHALGYITVDRFTAMAEKTMASTIALQKFRGHLLNWYDTTTREALPPFFVSSVDSGNLGCSLICLKQGCLQSLAEPILRSELAQGLRDHAAVAMDVSTADDFPVASRAAIKELIIKLRQLNITALSFAEILPAIDSAIKIVRRAQPEEMTASVEEALWWLHELWAKTEDIAKLVADFFPWFLPEYVEIRRLLEDKFGADQLLTPTAEQLPALTNKVASHVADAIDGGNLNVRAFPLFLQLRERLGQASGNATRLTVRLTEVAEQADRLVREMDFSFLYDPKRKLLSVGYDTREEILQKSCYDLLASEARSASFLAIARGDIPQMSWFQLGRKHTHEAGRDVLLSWTGTMFEYLMPTLWMKTYPSSLLERTAQGAVICQRAYTASRRIPWGISEGASIRRTEAGHFEYYAFGVPSLALKTEHPTQTVITPYASVLALGIDTKNAVANLQDMQKRGWLGKYGFFESAELLEERGAERAEFETVGCWMAHHQGMSLVAICNALRDNVFQCLFHQDVLVAATDRILHEKAPGLIVPEASAEQQNVAV